MYRLTVTLFSKVDLFYCQDAIEKWAERDGASFTISRPAPKPRVRVPAVFQPIPPEDRR